MSNTHNISELERAFHVVDDNKYSLMNSSYKFRKDKLTQLKNTLIKYSSQIQDALEKDFGKSRAETILTEVLPTIGLINYTLNNLKKWMRPTKVGSSLLYLGTKSYISYEAKGNVLILCPWNYPVNLTLAPFITSFAAGNTNIIKPSEFTPHTNKVLRLILTDVFATNEVQFIEGDAEAAKGLLNLAFDHIFFTGSTQVGSYVMRSASKHLASVTLELGGKSPVIVTENCNLEDAAEKIVWGKFLNAGQTCVAPDYLYIHDKVKDQFISLLMLQITKMYGDNPTSSADYCGIINSNHFKRLSSLLENATKLGASIKRVGEHRDNLKFAPTLVTNCDFSMDILQEEIFGPILPVIGYSSLEATCRAISEKDNPLSLYIFSKDKSEVEFVRKFTTSGGLGVNELILHVSHKELPFGGAGKSGIGRYYGQEGFREFSNQRAVLKRNFNAGLSYFYAPYLKSKYKLMTQVIERFNRFL